MISKFAGTLSKKNTVKLGLALVLSNVFFFLLFTGNGESSEPSVPAGWVEVQLKADLLTPFQTGKKVLLVHRAGRQGLMAMLKAPMNEEGRTTVLVPENSVQALFQFERWEVLPYLKTLTFARVRKGEAHEIRY